MEHLSGASVLGRNLARNLLAGARLAFFVPVRALDYRVSAGQCFALILACLALWVALGVLQQGVPGEVDLGVWNIVGNPAVPAPQSVLASLLCEPNGLDPGER